MIESFGYNELNISLIFPSLIVAHDSVAALQHRPVCVLPCLNGGKCVGPYSCECPYGYTGTRCENGMFNSVKLVTNISKNDHMN